MDGCDIGIVICFDVLVKLFVIVSVECCVECWFKELSVKDFDMIFEWVLVDVVVWD